ncbi:tRNA (uridine(54)-C5)-methyltransferase TrmA [Campylobacter sp.]|uniref:tRNA (uridine(54)-C5)-methyltransferase TrmA n=1 Tax=Campylobacter sp. TaxID=205 RepID=UPI0026DCD78E|nr:tRNA (uridine(54)-C5)-methyltransferase TrmA [Campylobacter sp.]MDO4673955.1 tRNA (uridine(54)-C5)-methyltransferase TrmA [Campylobacter sp.]
MLVSEDFDAKVHFAKKFFAPFFTGEFESFPSPLAHYRTRAELSFYHEGDEIFYAMFDPLSKKKYKIKSLNFADEKICALMPPLLKALNQSPALKTKLFGVEFCASKTELCTTLLYHKDIELIRGDLEKLSSNLGSNLIARSRGKKLIFGTAELRQSLSIKGREFFYTFDNDCFIQPNTLINEKMIEWALERLKRPRDLLELYCGYGNFTLPLAPHFGRVLATELAKNSLRFAEQNRQQNAAHNITFLRMSSEDLSRALAGEREFFRLRGLDLNAFDFSHILLDPPRAGLSQSVMDLAQKHPHILYFSCNPTTLHDNLKSLTRTHRVENFALFDQFALTPHLECGVFLSKMGH